MGHELEWRLEARRAQTGEDEAGLGWVDTSRPRAVRGSGQTGGGLCLSWGPQAGGEGGAPTWAWAVCSSRPARSLAAASSSSCSRSPATSASMARTRDPRASFALVSSCSSSCGWRAPEVRRGQSQGGGEGGAAEGRAAHLGVVQLGLRAAQLLAQADGSGLGLAQGPGHGLQLSLWGREPVPPRRPVGAPGGARGGERAPRSLDSNALG